MRKLAALSVIATAIGVTSPAQASDYVTNGLLCIHHYEGSWTANTGNGYYGGLQMNYGYMWTYGREFLRRWGTANRWPVWAQLEAGRRGFRSRGWHPWPNTARYCRLI